jgi:hypothetical protein
MSISKSYLLVCLKALVYMCMFQSSCLLVCFQILISICTSQSSCLLTVCLKAPIYFCLCQSSCLPVYVSPVDILTSGVSPCIDAFVTEGPHLASFTCIMMGCLWKCRESQYVKILASSAWLGMEATHGNLFLKMTFFMSTGSGDHYLYPQCVWIYGLHAVLSVFGGRCSYLWPQVVAWMHLLGKYNFGLGP